MGIEPTWDSPHCPTPDLKSGSPTSELGTSGRFITDTAPVCRGLSKRLAVEWFGRTKVKLNK